MIDTVPDYESCSKEDLLDVLNHIDQVRYPERVAEIQRVLKDPKWLAKVEEDKEKKLAKTKLNKFHINRRLLIPVLVFSVYVLSLRLVGFFTRHADFWETYNKYNLGYAIPIVFILFFIINALFNNHDKKKH